MRFLTTATLEILKQFSLGKRDAQVVAQALDVPHLTVKQAVIRLQRKGYIEPTLALVRGSKTQRQVYKITPDGRQALKIGPVDRGHASMNQKPHGGVHAKAKRMDFSAAASPNRVSVMSLPQYVPPKVESARPGADDHKLIPSKGIKA